LMTPLFQAPNEVLSFPTPHLTVPDPNHGG
jgi:hypothetical protein